MSKKAFSLVEVILTLVIFGFVALIIIQAIKPKRYEDVTNLANSRKALETLSSGFGQILAIEKAQCPTSTFIMKPFGSSTYEYTCLATDSTAIVNLLANHLKFEAGPLDFCSYTSYCSDSNIKGARLAGGIYFGVEKFSSIQNCPAYRIPGETSNTTPANNFDGTSQQCWGKVYIDINGNDGANTFGNDVFYYGLGEFGVVR